MSSLCGTSLRSGGRWLGWPVGLLLLCMFALPSLRLGTTRAPLRSSPLLHQQKRLKSGKRSKIVTAVVPDGCSYVDTHVHIDLLMRKMKLPLDEYPRIAHESHPPQWDGSLHISCDTTTESRRSAFMVLEMHDKMRVAFGVHPHNAQSYNDTVENELKKLSSHPKAVALGEMGLDYYGVSSPRLTQEKVFIRQLQLAKELNLPVVVHSREAEYDTMRIMKDHLPKDWPVHVHCFTSSERFARQLLRVLEPCSLGPHYSLTNKHFPNLYIGFTGVITFAKELEGVVKAVPVERILLETDGPFMSPHPHRGFPCHSGYIPVIAEKIAAIHDRPVEDIYRITRKNTKNVYGF